MTTLRRLLHLSRELQCRRLTPEVGIYRAWLKELIEIERKKNG